MPPLQKAILATSSNLEHPTELTPLSVQFLFTCPTCRHVQHMIFFFLKFLFFLSTVNAEPSDDALLPLLLSRLFSKKSLLVISEKISLLPIHQNWLHMLIRRRKRPNESQHFVLIISLNANSL
ncbi:hypothetical protein PanWU01x14_216650 [Parasponia andersonii]|uniref:Uncharacterized protein n=1 Tax=Parasponia andersonii TaxID=3476 RepID=A0A2P5BRI5_PARAD|nr:hypothetical protein PanWU01x14_216650 [Parasponia andersonii]